MNWRVCSTSHERILPLVVLCGALAAAQDAQISGLIFDPSQDGVVAADLALRNEQTGGRRTARSNESGFYTLSALRPGMYRLTVRAPGFETVVREGIVLEVGQSARLDFNLQIGRTQTTITVSSGPPPVDLEDASVGTVIDRNLIDQMPLNGRGIQTLIELTPGVVVVPVTGNQRGQFVVDGQRNDANYLTVDGVSANFASGFVPVSRGLMGSPGFVGQTGGAMLPANNFLGTFSNLVSPDALQEFKIQTSTFAPEYGRSPGAQIGLITRSGTNQYSGTLFEYFRNDATDANDWFANQLGLAKPPLRFNNFGGSLGGPLRIPRLYNGTNRTFFFGSFEAIVMRQPQPPVETFVPSIPARQNAPASVAPLLDLYPLPNRKADPDIALDGFGVFVGAFSLRNDQRTYGLRVDHYFNDRLICFARYNLAPSSQHSRSDDAVNSQRYAISTFSLTAGLTQAIRPHMVNEVRLNGSMQGLNVSSSVDGYGGAKPAPTSYLFPAGYSPDNSLSTIGITLAGNINIGNISKDRSRQLQIVDNFSYTRGIHQFKFGVDYRWFSPVEAQPSLTLASFFADIYGSSGVYSGIVPEGLVIRGNPSATYVVQAFSAYAQDTWRFGHRLTATYGVRWEMNPAPHPIGGSYQTAQGLTDLYDFSHLTVAKAGTSLYPTQYFHFAPRLGMAWQLFDGTNNRTVLRFGGGIFFDLAQSGFEDYGLTEYFNEIYTNRPFGTLPADALTAISPENRSAVAAAPGYTLPRVYQWNVTLEQSLGQQTFSAAWVGAVGRKLIGLTDVPLPDNPQFWDLRIFGNQYNSSYQSLQLHFNRRFARRLQTMLSYTWSHSIDDLSNDLASYAGEPTLAQFRNPRINRGSSDFDVRHSFHGVVIYNLPTPHSGPATLLLKDWSANSIIFARSAPPFDLTTVSSATYSLIRPDLVSGQPLYLYGSGYPGGKALNPHAFQTPADAVEQGSLGRNVLRGFGAWQVDFALHRQIRLSERLMLQFRVEAFNIFNHPNFAPPTDPDDPGHAIIGLPSLGVATKMLNSGLSASNIPGQLNSIFQVGGPRVLQLAVRFLF